MHKRLWRLRWFLTVPLFVISVVLLPLDASNVPSALREWRDYFGAATPAGYTLFSLCVTGLVLLAFGPLFLPSVGIGGPKRVAARGLYIVSAIYGVSGQEIDVTARLKDLISDGVLDITVDNKTMGSDPAPNKPKQLRVRWLVDGVEDASLFNEQTHVVLPRVRRSRA